MLLFSLLLLPLLTNADERPPTLPTTTPATPPLLCIRPGTCYGLPAACQPDTDRNCRVWMDFNGVQRTVSLHINSEIQDGTFFALTGDIPSVETKEYLICVPRGGRRLRGDAVDGEPMKIVEELPSDPDSIQTYFNRNFICTFYEDELPENFLTRSNFFIAEGTPYSDGMVIPQLAELSPIGLEDIWTNGQLEEEAWGMEEDSLEPLDHLEHEDTEHQESPRMERRDIPDQDHHQWDCSQQGSCFGLPATCQPESDGNDCRVWVDLDERRHVRIHVNSEIHEEAYFALSQEEEGAESEGKDHEQKKKEYLICVPRAAKRLRGEAVDGEPVRIVDKLKSSPNAVQTYFNRNFICNFFEHELPKDFSKKSNKFFITEGLLVNNLTIPQGNELAVIDSDIWTSRHPDRRVRVARDTTETQIKRPDEKEVERQKRDIVETTPHQSEDVKEDKEDQINQDTNQKSKRNNQKKSDDDGDVMDEAENDPFEDDSDENYSMTFSPYIYPIVLIALVRFMRNGV